MGVLEKTTASLKPVLLVLAAMSVGFASVPNTFGNTSAVQASNNLGTIRGIVRDHTGSPIADATVAIFRLGTAKLLKQVRSGSDGSFIAKIIPGTYTVLAVAQGYNPVTLAEVEVGRAAQLNYGFKLERAGGGNTLPEKRLDRTSPKWVIRSAQTSRSIYQNQEGDAPVAETPEETLAEADENSGERKGQTVVETYFGNVAGGTVSGVNVATLLPVGEDAEVVLAGQTGVGANAPQRIEVQAKFRPTDDHQIRLNTSFGSLGNVGAEKDEKTLGQFSIQGTDEWRVREGIVVVFGFDYSRFVGAGNDASISPRLGFQYDLNAKTRFRSAYTTQTEERTWSKAIELENAQVIFREPVAVEDFVIEEGKPKMNRSRRLEFGIERVIDNNSSIEANAFFDTSFGRGVSFTSLPFESLGGITEFVANQQGDANGLRVVYNRRMNGTFSTAAGYSIGTGQMLSDEAVSDPADLFKTGLFHSFFGQVEADLATGTNVKTIFRFSPQATVFAIDPFQGRLAIYDPSLSVLVTQSLPTLGLPFEAEAVVDARNLFDFQTGVVGDEGALRLNSQRRALRGGILVRF